MVEKRATARGEIIANRKNSPLFQKFPLKSKKYKKTLFANAENIFDFSYFFLSLYFRIKSQY